MSTRALRKLQGGRKDLDLPNRCHDEEEEQEEDEDDDKDEQLVKETLLLPSKGPNRFDLLVQGSPSESEVKEDDDLSDNSDLREDGDRDGASPQPPVGSGARRKRKKKRKRGRVKVPASSEDPTDNDKDDIDNIIEEVNAISSTGPQQAITEKTSRNQLQRRWKNLRECFWRALKDQKGRSGDGAAKKRKYVYFDQLLFLAPTFNEQETTGNYSASHTSSQRFSSGHESSSSSTDVSGLSAASIQRRKQLKKRRSEPSAATDETSPPAASPTVPAAAAAAGASEAIINTTQILGSLLEAQRESRAESSEADDFGRMVGRSMKKLKQNQFHRCCIEIHQVIAKYQDAAEAPQAASPQQQQQLLPQKLPPQQQQQLLPQKLPPQHQQLPHQQPPATPQWAANFSTPTRDATPGPWMRDLLSPYTGPSTSGYQTPSTSGYQTPFVSYPQTTSTPASATQSAGPSTSTPASITVSSPQKTFLHAVTCIDRSLVAPLGNPISPLQTPDRPDLKRIAEEERLQNL